MAAPGRAVCRRHGGFPGTGARQPCDAAAGPAGESGWAKFQHAYNEWFNIPGFELWKFINLGLFVAFIIYVAKKPLSDAFKAKREAIRADLIRAEAEKKDAQARLSTAEGKLAQLENDKTSVLDRARNDAEAERTRLVQQTQSDVARISSQADAELARLAGQSRSELRKYAADESVRAAEALIRERIEAGSDARIVRAAIQQIGGLN